MTLAFDGLTYCRNASPAAAVTAGGAPPARGPCNRGGTPHAGCVVRPPGLRALRTQPHRTPTAVATVAPAPHNDSRRRPSLANRRASSPLGRHPCGPPNVPGQKTLHEPTVRVLWQTQRLPGRSPPPLMSFAALVRTLAEPRGCGLRRAAPSAGRGRRPASPSGGRRARSSARRRTRAVACRWS